MACKFNRMVDCECHECGNCGWNPKVAEERIKDWEKNNKELIADLLMNQKKKKGN